MKNSNVTVLPDMPSNIGQDQELKSISVSYQKRRNGTYEIDLTERKTVLKGREGNFWFRVAVASAPAIIILLLIALLELGLKLYA